MDVKSPTLRRHARSLLGALLLMCCAVQAHGTDSYDPANKQLSIPLVNIGDASYANVVVTVGSIVSGPAGATANGNTDSYDPASQQLTVQSVVLGSLTYHNVIVTVASLVSIGSVGGADTYDGAHLVISDVQIGGTVYTSVVVTVGSIISAGGGMPAAVWDSYDPASRRLTIAAVQFGSKVYTNAIVTVANVVIGGITGFMGYAFAASSADSLVGQFDVSIKGQLLPQVAPTVTVKNSNPLSIAADFTGRFVYVANANTGTIYQFRIGAGGALLPLYPDSIATKFTASYIVASPTGPFLYAASVSSGIYEFNIGPDGTLAPMSIPSVGGLNPNIALSIDPQGKYLFLAGVDAIAAADVLSVYPLAASGAAGAPTLYPTIAQGTAVAVDPTDTYGFQVTGGNVQEYFISGGFLSPGNTAATPGNDAPWAASIDPSGKYVYVTGSVVSQFTIGTDGVLQAMTPATVTTGTNSTAMAFAPGGKFAYVLNTDGSIAQFSIGSTGGLTLLSPGSASGDGAGRALIVVPARMN
jgi:6-phosphogluconolactonase (cycloisomerase 2 family)